MPFDFRSSPHKPPTSVTRPATDSMGRSSRSSPWPISPHDTGAGTPPRSLPRPRQAGARVGETGVVRVGGGVGCVVGCFRGRAGDLRTTFGGADDFGSNSCRIVLHAVLIEPFARGAVRISLHHERAIGDGRKNEGSD